MGTSYRAPEPIPGPEAFEHRSKSAQLSQSAFLLAAGGGVGGYADQMPSSELFPLPDLERLERKRKIPPDRAMAYVEASPRDMREKPDMVIPAIDAAPLAKAVIDKNDAIRAASLIETSMHSPHSVVRVSAAASAIDTTGPREDVVAILEEGASARDPLERDIARTALARIDPDHPKFKYLRGRPAELTGTDRASKTAIVTHGTFASRSRWWRPGGSFYSYLEGLQPSLHMHDESFRWSGLYSHDDRDFAAQRMADWLVDQGLDTPDVFAHSHGGTVANLATHKGAAFHRLVLLSWPVHGEWFPDFDNLDLVFDVRVKFDLVIMADRGGQLLHPPTQHVGKVRAAVNGWFRHSDTYDPAYWDRHQLPDTLALPVP